MTIERSTTLRSRLLAVRRLALLTPLAMVFAALAPPQASAQEDLFSFLWDGGSRSVVGFSSKYQPRQIIVSFGDRKLYWIHKKGEAISYPIAIPREQENNSNTTALATKMP